jgi:CHAT domain-containing protein/tetratricopeptide (TPR) repeat protein
MLRPRSLRTPLLVLAAGALAACRPAEPLYDLPPALARALAAPGIAPRLSAAGSFRACPEPVPAGGTIPAAACAPPSRRQRERLTRLALHARGMRDSAAALHLQALVDVVVDDPGTASLDRAVARLRAAAAVARRPAPVLADLSAALLVRAERAQAPRDLLEAYEAAERALRADPRSAAARYNRALALDRFGAVDEAAREWDAFLAVDSTSGWAREARRRRDATLALAAPTAPADTSAHAWALFAAAERLRRAAVLGRALERRPGGDASLADAVRAIRAARGVDVAALAREHRAYGAAMARFAALDYDGAEAGFARAAGSASPVLARWARIHLGAIRQQQGRAAESERLLEGVAGEASARHPALEGRARWPLARLLTRAERWTPALPQAEAAARRFAAAGERENEAAALDLLAMARFESGDADAGYRDLHRAARLLRPYRASQRRHNLFFSAADRASADGLRHAALRLQDEAVAVAARNGAPATMAEARLQRARYHAALGDAARARADVDAVRLLARAPDENGRAWTAAILAEANGLVSLRADPRRAGAALDSAAAAFARIRVPIRERPALVGGADARIAAGDLRGAARLLESALRRMDGRPPAAFDEQGPVLDRLVLLTLAEGRVLDALEQVERARPSLSAGDAPRRPLAPLPGETAVEYARIADTVLAWTISAAGVDVTRTVVDTVRFARTLREVQGRLARGAREAEVRPALAWLHGVLIAPVERWIGTEAPLVIVADGEIASVPFAALFDGRRERYVVQDRPVRFAVSLREAARRPAPARPGGVVLVSDPAFDARRHPLLERLRHARAETDSVRARYPGARVLADTGATRPAFLGALAGASVVHFAGHAVFDDARPARSYLLLAPSPGDARAGEIPASELALMDLRHVRLVVLSACGTVRGGGGRGDGFTSLSGALLAAGAGGTVGSTWPVDDRRTAALMTRFHAVYRHAGDGPRALRDAQLALLRSPDPALRSPAAWAAFRYTGG